MTLMQSVRNERIKPYIEKLGNCAFTVLAGAYEIFLEKPDKFCKIVTEFVSGLAESCERE